LQTLQSVVENYGPKTIALYAVTLWDAIKFEILQAQEDDLAEDSLHILATITITLSQGGSSGLLVFLKPIIKECNEHLEDAPTKQSEAAGRMLYSISSASWEACNMILTGVLPNLFALYQSTGDMPKRRALIHTLAKLIEANCQVFGDWFRNPLQDPAMKQGNSTRHGVASQNALHDFSKQILQVLKDGLASVRVQDVSYRLALLDACKQLVKAREILSNDEISQIIKILNNVILVEEPYGKDEARMAATAVLDETARQKPQLVIDESFPAFLAKLPDSDVGHDGKHVPVLEAFAQIGVEDKIFGTVIVRLKNKLNTAIQSDASESYVQAILSALLYTTSKTTASLKGTDTSCPYYNDLVLPLLREVPNKLKPAQRDDMVFGLIGRICNEIVRVQTAGFQSSISTTILNTPSPIALYDASMPNTQMSKDEGGYLLMSVYLMAALRREVSLPYDKSLFITRLIEITKLDHLTTGTRAAATQHISLLVNKFLTISELKSFLGPKIEALIQDASSTPIVFVILKSLVFRNAPLLNSIFPALVQCLSDEKRGPSIAYGFSALLQPDEILSKENHCVLSPLYKQKTFAMLVPDIVQSIRTAQFNQKRNYLIALSGILRWLPFAVIEPEVSSLGPLLLQTLDIEGEDDIKMGAIDMLTLILNEKGLVLEEHAGSIITRLLNMASQPKNPPRVRAKALQCLSLLPTKLRTELVIPYRKEVIKRLTSALDDRRRAVRAEAVRSRTKWIELDEVGSGDQDDD
jgi:DNA repair/transcription protein MET18/MMS19